MNIYFQKLDSLAYIFVADSMGLSSFKFVQWAPKCASMLQQSVGQKRILTSNSRSRSFKVIHFAISYRCQRFKLQRCMTYDYGIQFVFLSIHCCLIKFLHIMFGPILPVSSYLQWFHNIDTDISIADFTTVSLSLSQSIFKAAM